MSDATDITCHASGLVTVSIADAKGEFREYSIVFPPASEFSVVLHRVDTGAQHAVIRMGSATWRCSCQDANYRHGRGRKGDCKHLLAMRNVWSFARMILEQKVSDQHDNRYASGSGRERDAEPAISFAG